MRGGHLANQMTGETVWWQCHLCWASGSRDNFGRDWGAIEKVPGIGVSRQPCGFWMHPRHRARSAWV